MKLLAEINIDKLDKRQTSNFRLRRASRAIVRNQKGEIALLGVTKYCYHKLPGGGIKPGETTIKALQRECLEETGCQIKIIKQLGTIIEYRKKWRLKQKSYCYIAKVTTILGKPKFTREERKAGFKLSWVSLTQAKKLIKKYKPKIYDAKFMNQRDSLLLEVYTKNQWPRSKSPWKK